MLRLSVPADFASLRTIATAIKLFVRKHHPERAERKEVHDLRLAVQEACTNIIEHSLHRRPDARLLVVIREIPGGLGVEIQDQGPPYNPRSPLARPPEPTELAEGGYGLFLINTLVDEIHYRSRDGVNRLLLIKRWLTKRKAS
jgi:serine/threonine-protein kinase RsbW